MPDTYHEDYRLLDFVANFVLPNQETADFARSILFDYLTATWMLY